MKIDLAGINNIIFDLGGVILNIDSDSSVEAFKKLGFRGSLTDGKLAYSDEIFYKLQNGAATPDEFRDRVRFILGNPSLKNEEIDDAWCAMIGDIPFSRVETIGKLGKNFKVFLFSNTNKIHIDYLEKKFMEDYGFSFASLFDCVYYSHEIGLAKPDAKSFRKIIGLSGIAPEETIFVDDIKDNVEGALKAGLKVYWLKDKEEMADIFN